MFDIEKMKEDYAESNGYESWMDLTFNLSATKVEELMDHMFVTYEKKSRDSYAEKRGFGSWNHLLNSLIIFERQKELKDVFRSYQISEFEKIKGYSSNFFNIKDWEDFDKHTEYDLDRIK